MLTDQCVLVQFTVNRDRATDPDGTKAGKRRREFVRTLKREYSAIEIDESSYCIDPDIIAPGSLALKLRRHLAPSDWVETGRYKKSSRLKGSAT